MVLDYDRRPDATVDEKLQSLMENIQLALNEKADLKRTLDLMFPVGAYYETTSASVNPNRVLSGTWTLVSSKGIRIVEEGTSGIWTYRKWSDGAVDCWGKSAVQSYAMTNPYGNAFYANLARFNFPSGLFISSPTVIGCRSQDGGSTGLISLAIGSLSETGFGGYVFSTSSLTTNVGFAFYAHGKWTDDSETRYRWRRTA